MKVVFLDIDGVLNSTKTANPRSLPYVADPMLVDRYVRLIARTGAISVLTSSWRIDPIGQFAARYWRIPFSDMVPDMPADSRDKEIKAWLARHAPDARFAVLDDEDDDLDEFPLFQPSGSEGLTDEMARGVEDYLEGRTDRDMRKNVVARTYENVMDLFKRRRT